MPAKSKKQQRFFGLVHAYQQGKVKNPSEDVKRVAASISESDAEHFAKTKHEGLPEKAASWLRMFKQAGGTGHEAFLAAEQARKTLEKGSQFKEVDPYRRYNVDARAQKVLSKLLEPEDSEKEFEKKKKEVDKKVDEDKETLRVGTDVLAKALNTISDFIGD